MKILFFPKTTLQHLLDVGNRESMLLHTPQHVLQLPQSESTLVFSFTRCSIPRLGKQKYPNIALQFFQYSTHLVHQVIFNRLSPKEVCGQQQSSCSPPTVDTHAQTAHE